MTRPVIRVDELDRGVLLKHSRFGDVVVAEKPVKARDLVKVVKVSNNVTTHVKRQELSWQ